MIKLDLPTANAYLRHLTPDEIIEWTLQLTDRRIVTTSFGVYSAVLLSTFARKDPNIDVIWCDTGFNDHHTYAHAASLSQSLKLNLHIYTPRQSRGFIEATLGLPSVDDPRHEAFTELVKLEPFRRALAEHQPEMWYTNIRVRQTEYRNSKDILSYSKDGILKVSPFYYWSDEDLEDYLVQQGLPKNIHYFDPVKALSSRECGIQMIG